MKKIFALAVLLNISLMSFSQYYTKTNNGFVLTAAGASHLASLPLKCMQQEFLYKTGIVFSDSSSIVSPKEYHPAFYGCFDWHSSVHGHWMLVRLLKMFPRLPEAAVIRKKLSENLTAENIETELKIFQSKDNRGFERTYGWAWLLQLQHELMQWDDTLGRQLAGNVAPLAKQVSILYRQYLDKLIYPIRIGEHANLAFGLKLAFDYAYAAKDDSLKDVIQKTALRFYKNDKACPLNWEPGGNDFLSPCLEEADLMRRVLPVDEFQKWIVAFLPQLIVPNADLAVGEVKDRTDGKLVHLDGLNFSRAWCLSGIAAFSQKNKMRLLELANKHLEAALPHVVSGDYMGEHWLASFAVYALSLNLDRPGGK